ncbi:DUF1614 domain-containing protein [uncultured Methylovirgula sp.]|uniref:DUF1614 domain-containing protein n=1 Tax=uncultured Methylovirgula sp. TaxID=1285960 RepID=UPI0026069A68|nr:DUF1614 domain-containing protein [uncultured Methylovirgula sp.]
MMHYWPLSLPFFILLGGIFVLLVIWVEVRALMFAYTRAGISSPAALFMLFASLAGSYVNIPLFWLHGRPVVSDQEVDFFGVHYIVPVAEWQGTVVAVNVGGCVIPVLLSLYILTKYDLWVLGAIGTAIVAIITHQMATPVHGVGIALPIFVPPIVTAVVAVLLSRRYAGPLAYVSGSLGVLIGADLSNLSKVATLGAPVASIGGAGTFDGIFLTGVLAVLLASITGPRYQRA